jgi:hypothetical protein
MRAHEPSPDSCQAGSPCMGWQPRWSERNGTEGTERNEARRPFLAVTKSAFVAGEQKGHTGWSPGGTKRSRAARWWTREDMAPAWHHQPPKAKVLPRDWPPAKRELASAPLAGGSDPRPSLTTPRYATSSALKASAAPPHPRTRGPLP